MANDGIKGAVDALGALAEMSLVFYRTALRTGATREEAKAMLEAYMSTLLFHPGEKRGEEE